MTRAAFLTLLCLTLVACNRGESSEEASDEGSGASAEMGEFDDAAPDEASPEATEPEAQPAPRAQAREQVRPRVEVRRPEVEANRRLAEQLGLAPPPPLIVADLLTRADVREVTGYTGELQETTLEGIEPSTDYNAIRLAAADKSYGFALQLWQFGETRQVTNHFRRLRETYFSQTVDGAPVGNEAFQAEFLGLHHYAFLHRASKSVAVVSCDALHCTGRQTRSMAQRVSNRL